MTAINVIGLPFGVHGLGQELRDKVRAFVAHGFDVCVVEANYSSITRRMVEPDILELLSPHPKHDINLICHNLPATSLVARKTPEFLAGRYNIGAPYWEFEELPATHQPGLDVLDEIWTSNSFLSGCFRNHCDIPIEQMPLHLPQVKERNWSHNPRHIFRFGYVFDFNSLTERKDPMALVLAFLEAFSAEPNRKVELVLKYSYQKSSIVPQRAVDDFLKFTQLDPRIKVISDTLSSAEMGQLMASFDAYVSPHKAEGLGRGVVESLGRGSAVLATNYSGPAEFLDESYAYPLASDPSFVGSAALGDIKPWFRWADVQIESLIHELRTVADNQKDARAKGKKAAKAMREKHGPKEFAAACFNRLKEIDYA